MSSVETLPLLLLFGEINAACKLDYVWNVFFYKTRVTWFVFGIIYKPFGEPWRFESWK